jgi:hypothetical protein
MNTLINLCLALVLNITGAQIAQEQKLQQDNTIVCHETIGILCNDYSISKNEQSSTKNHSNEY